MRLAEFSVNADDWHTAIQAINKLAVPFNGTINISVGQKILIESRAELAAIKINLPVQSLSGEMKIGIMLENLRLATANKKGLITFYYEDTQLKIECGNYSSAINTVDFVPYDDIEKQELTYNELNEEACKFLTKAVRQVILKPNLTTPIMPVLARLGRKSSLVCCYALDHLAFIKTDFSVAKPIELSMPIELLLNILTVFDQCKVAYNDSVVMCESAWAKVFVSLPATDAYIESKTLLERLQMFMKQSDGSEIELDKKELVDFFGNSKAVASKERSELIFDCQSKLTTITRSTSFGRTRLELPRASKECQYKLDGEYFAEAVNQCKEEKVKLTCYKDLGFTLINTQQGSYMILALNKD